MFIFLMTLENILQWKCSYIGIVKISPQLLTLGLTLILTLGLTLVFHPCSLKGVTGHKSYTEITESTV